MKKVIFLVLFCILLLTGCSEAQPQKELPHFSVMREQTEIALDAPAEPVLEALGAPCGFAVSSAHSRTEKTYRFPGMNLQTYSAEDGERILGVLITDSRIPTPEGLCVGASAADVLDCYGTQPERNGCCVLSRSSEKLVLVMENNMVKQIQYSLV